MLRDGGFRRLLSMREQALRIGCAWRRVHDRASGMFCKAGLWLSSVFALFRPVIDGQIGRPARRRPRGFPIYIPRLTGKGAAAGCGRPPVFPCYLQGNTGKTAPRGSPSHVADAALHHYLTRVGGGTVEGLISHGLVATFQKPLARGRARAAPSPRASGPPP